MTYDPIFSASRSSARSYQRKTKQRRALQDVKQWIERTTKFHVREAIDLRTVQSEVVRAETCSECKVDYPWRCEAMRNQNGMYYCRFLSSEYAAYVRLYLPSKRTNSPHNRANIANRLEELIRDEPGIRRTRIRETMHGRWEVILDVLENDLVFQDRVKRTDKKENGIPVYRYYVMGSPVTVPNFNDTICESAG